MNAIQASFDAAALKSNAIVAGKPSFDTQVEMFGHATSTYGPFTESAETWQYIAADRAREAGGENGENRFVVKGIGALVAAYGQQLATTGGARYTAHFGATIDSVSYDDTSAVLGWGRNSLKVDACIVTAPVSVLGSGAIAFTPALPDAYKTALKALRLGSYKKLALALRTGTTIHCADSVLEEAGIAVPDEQEDEVEKFREFLDQISPDDFLGGGAAPEDR